MHTHIQRFTSRVGVGEERERETGKNKSEKKGMKKSVSLDFVKIGKKSCRFTGRERDDSGRREALNAIKNFNYYFTELFRLALYHSSLSFLFTIFFFAFLLLG